MEQIFALTTRGLEDVGAQELRELPGVRVTGVAYRRITASCAGPIGNLLGLRTVDDLFLNLAAWSGIGRPRDTLARLHDLSTALDLHHAASVCGSLRPIGAPPTVYVGASFIGKRNYRVEEIKAAVATGIAASHGWRFQDHDAGADLSVRVFIEHEDAFVGVRLGRVALHERAYKQAHLPGSLKPSVAAALVALSAVAPGMRVLDPCCGAGTILIEAALGGAKAQGGDQDATALAAAAANAAAAQVAIDLQQWDAQALPLADRTVDRVVSNLPWGRQIVVDTSLAQFYQRSVAEMQRVLAPAGRIVLLTGAPELVVAQGLHLERALEISLYGQTPKILVFSAGEVER